MAPFATVLIPIDGSELSERALHIGQDLAQRQGGRIVLVRAAEAHVPPGADPSDQQVAAVREAEGYLQTVVDGLALDPDRVEQAVPYGPAADSILLEIELRRADLVVMSSHGRGGLSRLVLGSVAADVVKKSPVPVLVIPGAAPSIAEISPAPRVVVGLDGSNHSLGVLSDVLQLLGNAGGSVTLVHAMTHSLSESDVNAYLNRVRSEIAAENVEIRTRVARGDPATVIIETADESQADVIAVATHGRTNLGRLLLGSVAERVIQSSQRPILVRRPDSSSSMRWTAPELPLF
jgi:nucleotide-binding universal stress UspA family protein